MKKLIQILLVALTLSMATISFADTPTTPNTNDTMAANNTAPIKKSNRIKFYIGGDAGYGTTNCDDCEAKSPTLLSSSTGSTTNSNFAGTIFVGIQPNANVAAEFGYGVLPSILNQASIDGYPSVESYTSLTHYYGAVVLNTDADDEGTSLFAKIGYGGVMLTTKATSSTSQTSTSGTGPFLAVGLATTFAPNTMMTFTFNQILAGTQNSSDELSISYGTIGIYYLFG